MAEEKTTTVQKEAKFKGKYIATTGRRKTSVARVRVYKKGNGAIVVNGLKMNDYFSDSQTNILKQILKQSNALREMNFSIVVSGGGKNGQAEAIRHGIARALLEMDEENRPSLRAKGWLTRDARRKERKKPGLKKARKRPQWSKR